MSFDKDSYSLVKCAWDCLGYLFNSEDASIQSGQQDLASGIFQDLERTNGELLYRLYIYILGGSSHES